MNDQRQMLEALIDDEGGLVNCDLVQINKNLNRHILGAIDYERPIEEMRRLLAASNEGV